MYKTMKKSYIQPDILIVQISSSSALMNMSILENEINGSNAGFVKVNPIPDIPNADFWKGDWGLDAME